MAKLFSTIFSTRNHWFLGFLLASSTLLPAQSRLAKPEIYVGGSAGATGSMLGFMPTVNQTYLLGYNGGLTFRYIGDKNVGVQAELNYSQRGWKELNGLYSKQLNYIELPFLTHIYIGRKFRFIINLGPKISYLISEKELNNETVNSTATQHITPTQNTFDYGLCAGLGMSLNIKKSVIQLETRANYGLSDIYSNAKKDYFDKSNNMNLAVNLSWLVRIK